MSQYGNGPGHPGGEPDVPEFTLDPDDGTSIPRGWTVAAALLGVIALVAVVAGVANMRSGSPTEAAEPELSIDTDRPSPAAVDLAPAGPRDGLESLRLPITVDPADNLLDGQTVKVTGSQFPPNTALGVVMCSGAIDLGGGSAQCQLSPYTSVESDADGNFAVDYQVRRMVVVGGELIDCASQPPEGAKAPTGEVLATMCTIAVGAISDYDQSGVFPVGFDDSVPAPEPPSMEVSPSEGLVDGDLVTVTVTGAGSDWGAWPSVCTTIEFADRHGGTVVDGVEGDFSAEYYTDTWCEPLGGLWPESPQPTGTFEAPISRWFGALTGIEPIDCGESSGRCWIEVYAGPLPIDPVPLNFDPSVPAGPPPTVPAPPPYDDLVSPPLPSTETTTVHAGS